MYIPTPEKALEHLIFVNLVWHDPKLQYCSFTIVEI